MYKTYIYYVDDAEVNSYHEQVVDFSVLDYIIQKIYGLYGSIGVRMNSFQGFIEVIIAPAQH